MMVSIVTSQVRQFTERFFHQSGLFKIFPDTRYGMDGFSVSDLKFNWYGKNQNQKNQDPMKPYRRVTEFCREAGVWVAGNG